MTPGLLRLSKEAQKGDAPWFKMTSNCTAPSILTIQYMLCIEILGQT